MGVLFEGFPSLLDLSPLDGVSLKISLRGGVMGASNLEYWTINPLLCWSLSIVVNRFCGAGRVGRYASGTSAGGFGVIWVFGSRPPGNCLRSQLHALKCRLISLPLGLPLAGIRFFLAVIRWWSHKVDKQNVVARSNEHYGIPDRRFVTNASKAKTVTQSQLDKVRDDHVRMSLELQQAFGLRREEVITFQPRFAEQGDHIVLKANWTKGGKEWAIPVRTKEQRDVLNRAWRLAGFGSLIPSARNYVHQLRVYEGNTLRAGLSHMHGLRHSYAQNRYEELTGWKAPAAGGPGSKVLTSEQREADRVARLTISRELGHEREAVTAAYLGR